MEWEAIKKQVDIDITFEIFSSQGNSASVIWKLSFKDDPNNTSCFS
jgi:hypothetical protein